MNESMNKAVWVGLVLAVWQGAAWAGHSGGFTSVASKVVNSADFVGGGPSNVFPSAKGPYHGLIQPRGDFSPKEAGDMRVNVSSSGCFSGWMNVGGATYSIGGEFNNQGLAGVHIYQSVWDDWCWCYYYRLIWIITLELPQNTDEIHGKVTHARLGWTSDLLGYRGYTSDTEPAQEEGKYTLRLPGSDDPTIAPAGEGYGTMKVDSHGQLSVSGQLADGTTLSRSAIVSTKGWWPFYMSLSNGEGALFGWLRFASLPNSDVSGDLLWVRPQRSDRDLYPDGYVGTVNATGSRYTPPGNGTPALGWVAGRFWVSGGDLSSPLTNAVTLRPNGKLTDLGGGIENLKFSLTTKTGLFKGKFTHPGLEKTVSYSGVLDQLQDVGGGYFIGSDQGGLVRLEAAP